MPDLIEIVVAELAKYEHPFFEFAAEMNDAGEGVVLRIRSKVPDVLSPEYRIVLSERDLTSSQFPWTFQKLLYDTVMFFQTAKHHRLHITYGNYSIYTTS